MDEIIKNYLKEHLKISLDTALDTERPSYANERLSIKILLDNEVICADYIPLSYLQE